MKLLLMIIASVLMSIPVFADDIDQREMWEEPSHQLVFEQNNIRILDVRIVPDVTSEFHSHHFATVYFIVQDALMQNQDYGDEWGTPVDRQLRSPGSLMDRADYVDINTYHRVKNYDDHTFHLLSVVNSAKPDSTGPDEAASDGDLLNNPWFAEHRISLAPGATSEMLSFGNEVVLTQSREGLAHVVEEGVVHSARSMPGSWSVHGAGSQFQIVNASVEAQEFTLIEVRH